MKIAVCDDDKQELLQINRLVDEYVSCGFAEGKIEVHGFESSIKLLDQMESNQHFDIFLLDIIIPGLNGIELAAEKSLTQDGFTTTSNRFVPVSRNNLKKIKQTYINYSFQSED